MVHITLVELEAAATRFSGSPQIGGDCAWLEAAGYDGVEMLLDAIRTTLPERRELVLRNGPLGVDGAGVSAVFLSPQLMALAKTDGRIVYRNARHGLYVLPGAVREGLAVGCPIDPAFPIGGPRTSNPYAEKVQAAMLSGVEIRQELWDALNQAPANLQG